MAVTDAQKVDFLLKKLGYGLTKTDTNANKKAPNEAIASPLLLRADKVWTQASSIPTVLPGSSSGVVTVHPTGTPIECVLDATATTNRTWKTQQINWIPPEIGSTYQVKVYVHTSGNVGTAAASGTQVFATGSGNNDEWFFDYQSGVLHYIGANLPNGVSFTGKSVYVSGGRYTGTFGVDTTNIESFTFADNRIQTTITNEEIIIEPAGTGYVVIDTVSGLILPIGTTAQRPTGQRGMLRFNSTVSKTEVYSGSGWEALSVASTISLDEFDGDNATTAFTLSQTSTVAAAIISINGTIQEVTNAYGISGTTLTFTEAPKTGDKIQVRNFFSAQSITVLSASIADADNDTKIQVEESADEDIIRFDTAGTERMASDFARSATAASVMSRTVTSHYGQAISRTLSTASLQTPQPALKISICLFSVMEAPPVLQAPPLQGLRGWYRRRAPPFRDKPKSGCPGPCRSPAAFQSCAGPPPA